jgi:hypothetical protein
VFAAVDVAAEAHPFLGDLADVAEAVHLEPAAVGEDGTVPSVEAMQAAGMLEHLRTRPQVQVVGVAEHDGRIEVVAQLAGMHGLHGTQGTHGHEHRGGDVPVVGVEHTGPGVGSRHRWSRSNSMGYRGGKGRMGGRATDHPRLRVFITGRTSIPWAAKRAGIASQRCWIALSMLLSETPCGP